jgi:putative lipoic acid-binding regulatory protein
MKEDFYKNLKNKLDEQTEFPSIYMFKFIIPADNKKLALVEALFGAEAHVTTRQSSTNKFISITAKEMMLNADEIIAIYKKAEKIEGIISL